MNNCPCGSGTPYAACCEPIITGATPAASAEALMRARYSAHVNVHVDFIFDSTHPEHREGLDRQSTQSWAENTTWLGLEILHTAQGGVNDNRGEVEFIARFREKEEIRAHHERAQFQRVEGQWYFTDGSMVKPQPLTANKIGRNDPCPCGSEQKYKKCCGK
ncbi:MAG: YchJ family protein [Desulfuromonadales bacterium]|nr:YchJ family protein [Desulfuromonadales bacterium]